MTLGSHDFLKDKSAEEIFSIVQLLTKEDFDRSRVNCNIKDRCEVLDLDIPYFRLQYHY